MIDLKFKMFLDRPGVMDRIDKKRRRVFFRAGAFGRTTEKRQMRSGGKKGRKSEPGQPPRSQTGLLRKLIYFGIDPETDSLVLGPQFTKQSRTTRTSGGVTIPELLNEGGRATILQRGRKTTVNATFLPRPFVDPVRPTVEGFYQKMIEETPL